MCADAAGGRISSLTVVLPAHNEEDILRTTVQVLLDGLRDGPRAFDVLIVENGSSDRTWAIAQDLEAEHPEVRAITSAVPDYGRALRTGLLAATGDAVVNFDVDYYDLDFAAQALARLEAGADIVVGTKRGAGAEDTRALPRRIVTGVFAGILRVGYGLRASDTHGMKALARARVSPLAERCVLGTDLFDTELVLRAERGGLVVSEIPVRVEEIRPARTPILRRVPRTLVGLTRLRSALRDT
ncbi:MAG: glycosyltransferase family 2 protein [Actinomycetota bacterium]|nr:glycosyltransferase family 2 protein [Actinomycetota bacterium]